MKVKVSRRAHFNAAHRLFVKEIGVMRKTWKSLEFVVIQIIMVTIMS